MGVCISYVDYRRRMCTYAALKTRQALHDVPPPYSNPPNITQRNKIGMLYHGMSEGALPVMVPDYLLDSAQ